jgi:4-amino-4-deoxy-L-arabinose transferase-like glycosyltransferase
MPLGWADLAVIPLIAVFSVPPLAWFAHHWTVIGNDAGRYLLAGSQLILGQGLEPLNRNPHLNHGPAFPALIGALIFVFGRHTETVVWAVRLLALLNPLLAYFLLKRISSPLAGLLAVALLSLFAYNVKSTLNIDAWVLTFFLLMLLALLAAIRRGSSLLALLSGLSLGLAILTKETAVASLPLALLAALLLGWPLRAALWHYLGVLLVCLPWWVWGWYATGEVYLIDRLPPPMQVPLMVLGALLVAVVALAYALGVLERFVADERRRRWAGWSVVVVWTGSLSALLLATAAPALEHLSSESLREYLLNEILSPAAGVVPVVAGVCGYVLWKAVEGNVGWRLLGLAMILQIPVSVLVGVEQWAARQFLIPQTLLLCALGALVVEAGTAALRGGVGYIRRLAGAVLAVTLVVLLVMSSVERVRALLPEQSEEVFSGRHTAVPQAAEMVDWMARNVPEREHILVTPALGNYLVYLDGGLHRWGQLQLDQKICEPRPNVQIRCDPERNDISRSPQDAVWVQMMGGCKAISLSMSGLLEQARHEGSGYMMITGSYKYPGILKLPSRLEKSEAFEVLHAEVGRRGHQPHQGAVLLRSTGETPRAIPTQMNARTMQSLRRCEREEGAGQEKMIESAFPNGILVVSG